VPFSRQRRPGIPRGAGIISSDHFPSNTLLVRNDHVGRIASPLMGTLPGLLRVETDFVPFERDLFEARPSLS
jgi:hypothetical protein